MTTETFVGCLVIIGVVGLMACMLFFGPNESPQDVIAVSQAIGETEFEQWRIKHNYSVTSVNAWDNGKISVTMRKEK